MIGLGTIINVALIVAGGAVGLLAGRLVPERVQEGLLRATGVAVLFIGLAGALAGMLSVGEDGAMVSGGSALVVASLALGTLVGELLDISAWFERLGTWLRRVSGNQDNARFLDAFLTATFTVCIGAMAVVGAIQDGILGDWSTLALKGVLDALIIASMAASMGVGCLFAAVPVAVLQGSVTLLARLLSPLMTDAALASLSCVGSILIFCVGVNLVRERTFNTANMLPAVVVAVALALVGVA
ncbi:DUF554 domain-containing protein [Olsenella profusa]|uniref:DUF554 domain-containing protein n=1 Tax=Olsenella profusa TaxID=138595 RepID=A0ABS2F3I2_9ACTN|nr:DUF554 domain-containing protein [Olsenella profusa]MBM6775107.1 DUF554 domain-containing protein [Olsenella profusa]